ncbi:MAG: hypothetical protein GWP08_01790 [Nitrospiraceae bacterium]|nr:hypothetical protein [Nitrospiraceae bacterium]
MHKRRSNMMASKSQPARCWRWVAVGLVAALGVAMAQEGETIKPGDVVFVDVYRRAELSSTAQVDMDGNVQMPYVGNVNIGGVSETEASARISKALRIILKNPRVTVSRTARTLAPGPRTASMKTRVVALNNSSAEKLAGALKGMSSEGGAIGFDSNSNSLIITDTPAAIQDIMGAVGQLDEMQSLRTQVRIDTKLAEVKVGAMKELGIRWFYKGDQNTGGYYPPTSQNVLSDALSATANEAVGGGTGAVGNTNTGLDRRYVDEPTFNRRLNVPVQVPVVGQLFFGVLNGDYDIGAMLDALVADNNAELLASPSILAVNHTQAEIKMLDEFPYTEASQSFGGTSFSVKFMDLGIKLLVTPHVYRDTTGPYVKMELNPEVSFATGMSNGIPVRAVRSSDSTALLRDGQTLVIGGIVLNDERKMVQAVPGLGKIPLVGALFRRKERARTRNELMVFVTPAIHEAPESVTWDRVINLTGSAKGEVPLIPSNQVFDEVRKE